MSNSYNKQWLNWIEQNNSRISYLIYSFPDIINATELEETSLDIEEYCDLIDTMIIALRFPQWMKVLDYMGSSELYDKEIESILIQLDDILDNEGLTDMEHELAEQMYDQYLDY